MATSKHGRERAPDAGLAPARALLPAKIERLAEAHYFNEANAAEHQAFELEMKDTSRNDARLRLLYHESDGRFAAYFAGFPPTDPDLFLVGTGRTKIAARRMLICTLIHPAAKRIAHAIEKYAPESPALRRVFAACLLRHDGKPVEARGVTFATRRNQLSKLLSAIDGLLDESHVPELLPLLQRLAVPDGINSHRLPSGHTKTRRGYRLGLDAIGDLPEYLKDLRAEVLSEIDAVESAHRRIDDSPDPNHALKQRTPFEAQIRRLVSVWRRVFSNGSSDKAPSRAATRTAARAWGIQATVSNVRSVLQQMNR